MHIKLILNLKKHMKIITHKTLCYIHEACQAYIVWRVILIIKIQHHWYDKVLSTGIRKRNWELFKRTDFSMMDTFNYVSYNKLCANIPYIHTQRFYWKLSDSQRSGITGLKKRVEIHRRISHYQNIAAS